MGKASRWFRGLLGLKISDSQKPPKEKRRWSFVKSYREEQQQQVINNHATTTTYSTEQIMDNKQAIAVAVATAAAAEAAVAAAQAAAAVVRFTTNNGIRLRQEWAVVKIQAAFRGSLARKALRALKGLVKLQALVRGHIERKRTAEWLKRMQALVRTQAQARVAATRNLQTPHSNAKSSACHLHSPATPEISESPIKSRSIKHEHSHLLKRNGSKSCVLISGNNQDKSGNIPETQLDEQSWHTVKSLIRTYNGKSDRIVEIDSAKQQLKSKRRSLFHSTSDTLSSDHYYSKSFTSTKESSSLQSGQTQSVSCEVNSYTNSKLKVNEVEESPFCTAHNSPQFLSATSKDEVSKRSPFTRSGGSKSYYLGDYLGYPSYMANTESSKAKARSLSAPKQRPQYERSGSSNRYSLNGYEMSRMAAAAAATQKTSALQTSFASKGYPGSGRLDKLGMPVGFDEKMGLKIRSQMKENTVTKEL